MPVTEIHINSDDDLKQNSVNFPTESEPSHQLSEPVPVSTLERDNPEEMPEQVSREVSHPGDDQVSNNEPTPVLTLDPISQNNEDFSFTPIPNQSQSPQVSYPRAQFIPRTHVEPVNSKQSTQPQNIALPSPSTSASSSLSSLHNSINTIDGTQPNIDDNTQPHNHKSKISTKQLPSHQQYAQNNPHHHLTSKHSHHHSSSSSSTSFYHSEHPSGKTKSQHLSIQSDRHHHPLYDYLHPTTSYVTQSKAYINQHNNLNNNTKIPKLNNTYLKPNATFFGEQQSGPYKYHIKVEFKTVDLINSLVTGFLQISGLTDEHPEITTCFKGEIINNPLNRYDWGGYDTINKYSKSAVKKYSFITEHDNWGSFSDNDLDHWKKLTGSYDLNNQQLKQKLLRIQRGEEDNQFLYMRWKEEFLLPDSRIKQISGASFEGFYYIVLNIGGTPNINNHGSNNRGLFNSHITPGTISGLYYHTASDKFQSLSLRYVEDHGVSNTFEFV